MKHWEMNDMSEKILVRRTAERGIYLCDGTIDDAIKILTHYRDRHGGGAMLENEEDESTSLKITKGVIETDAQFESRKAFANKITAQKEAAERLEYEALKLKFENK